MWQFRTTSLFHYTKKIEILKSILKEGLIPNYCYEDLSYPNNDRGIGVPMISFCDIPLSKTDSFIERYGNYAIGLTKEWADKKRINPILYAKDDNILTSLSFYKSVEMHYRDELKKYGENLYEISFDLSPGPKPQIASFFNYHNTHKANVSIHGMVKKYYDDVKDQRNYDENEWRYLVEDTNDTPWFWSKEVYKKWRGDKNTSKPSPTKALKDKKLEFSVKDIAFVLIKEESEIPQIVDFINKEGVISDKDIDDYEKLILCSRIISFERIKKNF